MRKPRRAEQREDAPTISAPRRVGVHFNMATRLQSKAKWVRPGAHGGAAARFVYINDRALQLITHARVWECVESWRGCVVCENAINQNNDAKMRDMISFVTL